MPRTAPRSGPAGPPTLIPIGFFLYKSACLPIPRHLGRIASGLGLLLPSLLLIVGAPEPLRRSETRGGFIVPCTSDPILAVLLIMSLTATGVVSLRLGFALVPVG